MSMRKPGKGPRRATCDPYKDYWDKNERISWYKKLEGLKAGTLDTSKPKTFKLSAKLSARKVRKAANGYNEHRINVDNMLRRMSDIGSMQERKKNN